MTKFVTLASSYPKLKLLTTVGKLEFRDGVCKVPFEKEQDAIKFIKQIKENQALGAYVRVVDDKTADKVVALNNNNMQVTSVQAGTQTSEAKEENAKMHVTAATVFNFASKAASSEKAKDESAEPELPLVNEEKE